MTGWWIAIPLLAAAGYPPESGLAALRWVLTIVALVAILSLFRSAWHGLGGIRRLAGFAVLRSLAIVGVLLGVAGWLWEFDLVRETGGAMVAGAVIGLAVLVFEEEAEGRRQTAADKRAFLAGQLDVAARLLDFVQGPLSDAYDEVGVHLRRPSLPAPSADAEPKMAVERLRSLASTRLVWMLASYSEDEGATFGVDRFGGRANAIFGAGQALANALLPVTNATGPMGRSELFEAARDSRTAMNTLISETNALARAAHREAARRD